MFLSHVALHKQQLIPEIALTMRFLKEVPYYVWSTKWLHCDWDLNIINWTWSLRRLTDSQAAEGRKDQRTHNSVWMCESDIMVKWSSPLIFVSEFLSLSLAILTDGSHDFPQVPWRILGYCLHLDDTHFVQHCSSLLMNNCAVNEGH
jgi:hypothetical protein